jgi:hypothetical protein
MRFFSLLDFQLAVFVYFSGLISVILVYIAWGGYPRRRHGLTAKELSELEGHEVQGGHRTEDNPIAPFLIFVYSAVIIWSISYAIFVGSFDRALW